MPEIPERKTPQDIAKILRRINATGERFVIRQEGKPIAALVSLSDLRVLRDFAKREEAHDLEAARKALAEVETNGTVSWEEVKARLGLE